MITVISATNRPHSATHVVATAYLNILTELGEEAQLLSFTDLPEGWVHADMYKGSEQLPALSAIQDRYIIAPQKIVYVVPEYNGSIAGILKLFIDACSVRHYKESFRFKKAALVGVASGRSGNLRGMEHLTGMLNHVQTIVHPNKLPISQVESLMNATKTELADAATLQQIRAQAEQLIAM